MRALFVTHGNEDPAARELLVAFQAQAARALPCPCAGATLTTLPHIVEPRDRVFALFFSEGGHVQRDLLPPVRAAGARFEGIIPAELTIRSLRRVLEEQQVPTGTRILLVGVKAVTDPALKGASLGTLSEGLSRHGYPASFALYNDEATLPQGGGNGSPPVALLLTLLPGYTLTKAREVFRARGIPLIAEAWLPQMTPELLQWAIGRLQTGPSTDHGR
jgi:hypothetical protein